MTLTCESVDEILWCDHSTERSLPVLCYLFFKISQNEIWKFGQNVLLAKFGSEKVKPVAVDRHSCNAIYSSSLLSKIELIALILPLSITSILHSC